MMLVDSIRKVVQRQIPITVEKILAERLPSMIEEIMRERFSKFPHRQLSKLGFEWAFYFALNKLWPNVDRRTSTQWLWEYVGNDCTQDNSVWTAREAESLALDYANECGE